MKFTWKSELPPVVTIVAMFVGSLVTWPRAPQHLPVHWDFNLQVDRWGGKFEGLLGLPLIALGIYLLFLFLPRLDPGRDNYERFVGAFHVIRLSVLLLSAGLHAFVLASVYGRTLTGTWITPFVLGIFLVVLGAMMGKLRPNWFLGIRTPWTLSSKLAWVRTHRLGGWLLVATGIVLIIVSLVEPRWSESVGSVGVLGTAGVAVVYSYLIWRKAPDKQPPAGTSPA